MTDIDHYKDPQDDAEAGAGRAINRTWEQLHGTDDATADGRDEEEAGSTADSLADLVAPLGGEDDTPDEPGRDLPVPPEFPDNRDLPPELPGEVDPSPLRPGSPYMETDRDSRSGGLSDDETPDSLPPRGSVPV